MDTLFRLFFDASDFMRFYYEKETPLLKEFQEMRANFENKLNEEMKIEFKKMLDKFQEHMLKVYEMQSREMMYSCLKIGMECQDFLDKRHE